MKSNDGRNLQGSTGWHARGAGPLSKHDFLLKCESLLLGGDKFEDSKDLLYAAGLVYDILENLPDAKEQAAHLDRVLRHLDRIANVIRWGVNSQRGLSPDRKKMLDRLVKTYRFKNIRHLELGTYDAFSNKRVAALKQKRGIGEFIRLDISKEFGPDVVADCTRMPFADNSIDSISSNSLFEHVAYPHKTIEESSRVLTQGGVMQVTMPFHFAEHFCPKDYLRLSPNFFQDICRQAGFKEVYCHVSDFGGLYYTMHQSSKAVLVDESIPKELYSVCKMLHNNVISLLALCTIFDQYFYGGGTQFFVSVYCVAIKDGTFQPRERISYERPMVKRMLPYLVCPVTGQRLSLDRDAMLIS